MNADKREPTLAEAPSLPGAKLGHDCNGWLGISNIGQNHEHRSFPERRTWPISGLPKIRQKPSLASERLRLLMLLDSAAVGLSRKCVVDGRPQVQPHKRWDAADDECE